MSRTLRSQSALAGLPFGLLASGIAVLSSLPAASDSFALASSAVVVAVGWRLRRSPLALPLTAAALLLMTPLWLSLLLGLPEPVQQNVNVDVPRTALWGSVRLWSLFFSGALLVLSAPRLQRLECENPPRLLAPLAASTGVASGLARVLLVAAEDALPGGGLIAALAQPLEILSLLAYGAIGIYWIHDDRRASLAVGGAVALIGLMDGFAKPALGVLFVVATAARIGGTARSDGLGRRRVAVSVLAACILGAAAIAANTAEREDASLTEGLALSVDRLVAREGTVAVVPGLLEESEYAVPSLRGQTVSSELGVVLGSLVPRALGFPKPQLSVGREVSQTLLGRPQQTDTNATITAPGSVLLGFGPLGALLAGALLMALLHRIPSPRGPYATFGMLCGAPVALNVEARFASTVVTLIQLSVVLFVLSVAYPASRTDESGLSMRGDRRLGRRVRPEPLGVR